MVPSKKAIGALNLAPTRPSRVSLEIVELRCALVDKNQEWAREARKGPSLSKCLPVACFHC